MRMGAGWTRGKSWRVRVRAKETSNLTIDTTYRYRYLRSVQRLFFLSVHLAVQARVLRGRCIRACQRGTPFKSRIIYYWISSEYVLLHAWGLDHEMTNQSDHRK